MYSDEPYRLGALVKLEFFVHAGEPLTYTAEVVWLEKLSADSPAKFDVGLKFVDLEPEGLDFLMTLLSPEPES